MNPALPSTDPRLRSRVVLFVFVTVFLDLVGFGVIIPLLPLYVRHMGGNAQTAGWILGCFSFTQLLATPVLGRLSDRVGRRPVILLSLAGNAASMGVFALAAEHSLLPLLFISRIVAGATAGNLAACQAAVADVTAERDRARAMGAIGAGIGVGLVLGPWLGGMLSSFGGWAPPLAAGAMAALDLLFALFFMPETYTKSARDAAVVGRKPMSRLEGLRAAIGRPGMAAVLALYFLIFLSMTNSQVVLPLLAGVRFGWGAKEVGYAFMLMGLIGAVLQGGLIGRLSQSLGEINLVIIGALTFAAGLACIAAARSPWLLGVGIGLIGTALGVANPVLAALASRFADPSQRGAMLGVAQSAGGLARTVGPVWSGLLFDKIAPGAPFVAGCCAALAAAVIGMGLKRTAPAETAR